MVNKMECYEVVLHILFEIVRVNKHCESLKLIYVQFKMHLGKYKHLWKLKTIKNWSREIFKEIKVEEFWRAWFKDII